MEPTTASKECWRAGGAMLAFGKVVVIENVMGMQIMVFYSEH